jgi:hypothetical protein
MLIRSLQNNGGQWDMVVNLINTYGLVPQSIFPESFHSSNTAKLGALITSKLRDYTLELRALHAATARQLSEADARGRSREEIDARAKQAARKRKEQMMEEVYRILAITLGTPPKANEPVSSSIMKEYVSADAGHSSYGSTTPRTRSSTRSPARLLSSTSAQERTSRLRFRSLMILETPTTSSTPSVVSGTSGEVDLYCTSTQRFRTSRTSRSSSSRQTSLSGSAAMSERPATAHLESWTPTCMTMRARLGRPSPCRRRSDSRRETRP